MTIQFLSEHEITGEPGLPELRITQFKTTGEVFLAVNQAMGTFPEGFLINSIKSPGHQFPYGFSIPILVNVIKTQSQKCHFSGKILIRVVSTEQTQMFLASRSDVPEPGVKKPEVVSIFRKTGLISEIRFLHGDIRYSDAGALVNASNPQLRLGAGISQSLNLQFPWLQSAMNQAKVRFEKHFEREFTNGDTVSTANPGEGSPRYIIHTATVLGSREVIRIGLRNTFTEADRLRITRICLPALGTGTGNLPLTDFMAELDFVLREIAEEKKIQLPDILDLINLHRLQLDEMVKTWRLLGWQLDGNL